MMAGVCAGAGPRGVHVQTGLMDTGLGGGLLGMCYEGIMGTLGRGFTEIVYVPKSRVIFKKNW